MSRATVALILTIVFWVGAVALVYVGSVDGGWLDLRPVVVVLLAAPATLLLWLVWLLDRLWLRLAQPTFVATALVVPIVCVAAGWVVARRLDLQRHARIAAQQAAAVLVSVDDEPLSGARGPVGVRVRYRVRYPDGLDLDADHGALAQVSRPGLLGAFVVQRQSVSPQPARTFTPGEYEFTVDALPSFMPWSILGAGRPLVDSDRCFRWPAQATDRESVLGLPDEPLDVAILVRPMSEQRKTRRSYRLADFVASAVADGAVECDLRGVPLR